MSAYGGGTSRGPYHSSIICSESAIRIDKISYAYGAFEIIIWEIMAVIADNSEGIELMVARSTILIMSCFLMLILFQSPLANAYGASALSSHNLSHSPDEQVISLTSPNSIAMGQFGTSEAIGTKFTNSGPVIAIGAPMETAKGFGEAGNVYVYDATNGKLLRTITSPNAQDDGNFGESVSIRNGILGVGAPGETAGGFSMAGNAYLFNVSTGKLLNTLDSSFPTTDASFGFSIAVGIYTECGEHHTACVNESLALVGAPGESNICGDGRAWTFVNGLVFNGYCSPNPIKDGDFGYSVAIGAGIMAVGAPDETADGLSEAGIVYTFDSHSGIFNSTLISPDAQAEGNFGDSVACVGGLIAVGAPGEGFGDGTVYTFDAYNGTHFGTFESPDTKQTDVGFGTAVALFGTTLLVGSPGEGNFVYPDEGHAYTFNTTSGAEVQKFTSQNRQGDGFFGLSVALNNDVVVVGAPDQQVGLNDEAGNVYIFST